MEVTITKLFEKKEEIFREELSKYLVPRDLEKIQNFMTDFFISKFSIEDYKKELSTDEIAVLNSVMKLVSLPMSWHKDKSLINLHNNKNCDLNDTATISNKSKIDVSLFGPMVVGGLIGGLAYKTWGGVLWTIAGCALGLYLSSRKKTTLNNRVINRSIDVDKYIDMLKSICKQIDTIIINYRTKIDFINREAQKGYSNSIDSSFTPFIKSIASVYASILNNEIPEEVNDEFKSLIKLANHLHYDFLDYNDSNSEYYSVSLSPHITHKRVLKVAILKNGELIREGECLIPQNEE